MLAPATEHTVATRTYQGAWSGFRTASVIIHRSTPLGKGTKEESSTAAAANPQIPKGRSTCSIQPANLLKNSKVESSHAPHPVLRARSRKHRRRMLALSWV